MIYGTSGYCNLVANHPIQYPFTQYTNMATIKSDTDNATTPTSVQEGGRELNQTTQFIDDANTVTEQTPYQTTIAKDLYMSNEDNFIQDIKTFLGKPIVMDNGDFTGSDSVSSITDISYPSAFLQKVMILTKTYGYYGIRGTMVFRLVLNATRFDMGRYIMAFIYTGGVNVGSNTAAARMRDYHKNTLTARTQLPHVEVDINCDTSAELRVPFVSAFNHTPIQNMGVYGDIGVLHISPYVTVLNTATTPSVGYTVYAHMEDVELFGAAMPQSISQQEGEGKGRVSNVLSKLKAFTDSLQNFPTLSSYAVPASWVLDISANAAKAVGWSKPILEDKTCRVIRDGAAGLCNADTVDTSKMQALFASNQVGILPGFSGTDIDELAISNIATKFAYFDEFSWDTEHVADSSRANFSVAPLVTSQISTRTVNGPTTVEDYTPLQFSAKFFKYWRGSIKYRFKFVKTEFHSGRLGFAFYLNDTNAANTVVTTTNSHYVHRAIVDIREHNEYTVTIPYMSNTPYKDNINAYNNIGTLHVYVVDPLRCPDTVPSSILILCEHAGGPDIEFAIPNNISMTPAVNVTPQSALRNDCSLGNETLGSSSGLVPTLINSEACIGERILSFRSLLKAYNTLVFTGTPTSSKFYNILPFGAPMFYDFPTNYYPSTTADLYTTFSAIFLFSRGSTRFKITGCSASNTNPAIATMYHLANGTPIPVFAQINTTAVDLSTVTFTNRLSIPTTVHMNAQNGYVEFQVPQYNRVHSRINSDHIVNTNLGYNPDSTSTTTPIGISVWSSGNFVAAEAVAHRAMGDDGNFGTFISIGPMVTALFRQV